MAKSLIRSVSVVSSMTFISRILGFVRDLIAAQIFGVNASVDAFYIAFKIPNFMRSLFAEGAFSQAFVPVLSDYREKNTEAEVKTFISHMAASLGIVLLIVTFLGIIGARNLIDLFSPGLDPYRYELAQNMLRITFPYLMLISLTAFAGSILNSYGKFAIPSFTPALLNVCLIATAVIMSPWLAIPVTSQAWGILLAGFVQLFMQVMALYRSNLLVVPKICWQDQNVKRVLKLIIPALFGASMGQLSILINTILASFLVTGSISWLYYSERLAYFPLGIFGVALATVILPHLSRQHATESKEGFSAALDWGLRWNLIIGIPASLTMLLLSAPLIISLFYYGKFTLHDVLMTQRAVIAYAIGLQAFMLAKIVSSAFYAKQNIQTPVKISMISLLINILLSLLLIKPLAHAGLALSSSLASWVNVITLCVVLQRQKIFSVQPQWGLFLLKLLFANGVLALFLWYTAQDLMIWAHWDWPQRLLHLVLIGLGAIALYLVCLFLTKAWPRELPVPRAILNH